MIKKKPQESVTSPKKKRDTKKNIKVILGIKDKENKKGQKSPIKPCIVSLRRLETEITSITDIKPRKSYMTPYGVAVTPCSVPLVPCDMHDNVRYKSKKSFPHKNCEEEDPLLISVRLKSGELLKTSTEILAKLCREIKSPAGPNLQ